MRALLVSLLAATAVAGFACSGSTTTIGGGDDGGSPDGASSGAGSSSGAGTSSGVGPTLACGKTTCMPPSQLCCISQNNGQSVFTCQNGMTCTDPNDLGLRCTTAADCPMGDVCCFDNNTKIASCTATCGDGNTQLCDPKAMRSGCPQGQQCSAGGGDNLPQNLGTCH